MINANGTVLVSDFGIARMSESATATMVGAGTPAYMAPEQARGEDPTPQTDIYALGVVLFEMLTGGERPFTGESAQTTGSTSEKIRWEQMKLEPPSPRKYNPAISPQLEEIILRCLNKNPAARYSSTLELLVALDTAISQLQAKTGKPIYQNVTLPTSSAASQMQVSQEKNQSQTIPPPKKHAQAAWIVTGSILLIAVILVCGITSVLNSKSQQAQANATSTAQAEAAIEAVVQATNVAETAIAEAKATATAQAQGTAAVEATQAQKLLLIVTPDILANSIILYRGDFSSRPPANEWGLASGTVTTNGILNLQGQNWEANSRPAILGDHQGVLLEFRCSSSAQTELFLQSGNWNTLGMRRWGVYCNSTSDYITSDVYQDTSISLPQAWNGDLVVKPGSWLALLLEVGGSNDFIARIWEPSNPDQYLEMRNVFGKDWSNLKWSFMAGVNQGELDIANYKEIAIP